MARSRRRQFTILAEGKRDYDFASTYLRHRYGRSNVECYRAQTLAAGRGAGEQQVRERFATELRALRAYAGTQRYLVVMIDGDGRTPAERRDQLMSAEAGKADDRVLIIVPCRNLENWFAWVDAGLDDGAMDETQDYKQRYRRAKPTQYAQRLNERCQAVTVAALPPSVAAGCRELARIAPVR
jgi:hypothetical protein